MQRRGVTRFRRVTPSARWCDVSFRLGSAVEQPLDTAKKAGKFEECRLGAERLFMRPGRIPGPGFTRRNIAKSARLRSQPRSTTDRVMPRDPSLAEEHAAV